MPRVGGGAKISSISLFHITDYGITVRGTVSTELPCLGKPVITAGTGKAHGRGFTVDDTSKEDYLQKLTNISQIPALTDEEILRAKRHAYIAFCKRPWIIKSFKTEFKDLSTHSDPLDHNLRLTAQDLEELVENEDLKKWATWAENEAMIDYLDPLPVSM